MGIVLGVLALVLVVGGITSGVIYAKQQAAEQRERQLRALQQKYEEHLRLYDVLFMADHEAEVPALFNKALLELARAMRRLNPKSTDILTLVEEHSNRDAAFSEGVLKPRGERKMPSDSALASLLSTFAVSVQKLQRLKIRGVIANHQYEEYALHLRTLALESEIESHVAFADQFVANGERLKAESHLKHARETLKKSPLEVENKAERIREFSERIKNIDEEIQSHQKKGEEERQVKAEPGNS